MVKCKFGFYMKLLDSGFFEKISAILRTAIAALIIQYLKIEGNPHFAHAYHHTKDIDLNFTKIPFRAVNTQQKFGMREETQ